MLCDLGQSVTPLSLSFLMWEEEIMILPDSGMHRRLQVSQEATLWKPITSSK